MVRSLAAALPLLFTVAANAATITITIAVTAQPDVSKVYTMSDTDAARIMPAYQSGANVMVNGTATRAQVLRYMIQTWIDAMKAQIQSFETVPAQVPPPINPQ